MHSDVDATGLECPDGSRRKESNPTGEIGILVLPGHFVLQCTVDGEQAARLPRHQGQKVYTWTTCFGHQGSRVPVPGDVGFREAITNFT